jgi:hypothetical protein
MYRKDEMVVLAANRYHLGIVREDQEHSRASVLVEWLAGPAWCRPDEILLESTHRAFHTPPRGDRAAYDVLEPIYEERSLWSAA